MKTSIIILTHNKLDYTKLCIESIRQYTMRSDYELIVIDNNSTDGTVEWLNQQQDIKKIINSSNVGFPKGCNQGIEISTGQNILLLNNDTVVTINWLDNLVRALWSSPDIGAVGTITNSAAYYQAVNVSYQTLDEMHQFSTKINQSDSTKWEERLKLIGFCMLVKSEVVEKVGLLDERFTPGNYEDDDYSLRIRNAGYRLLLCKDTFVHHFGSTAFKEDPGKYNKLLHENESKFHEKWGLHSLDFEINFDVLSDIKILDSSEKSVLHVGCAAGGTLLRIKNTFPSVSLFGFETNKSIANITIPFAEVKLGNIEEIGNLFSGMHFDYIVVSHFCDYSMNLRDLLSILKNHLQPDGHLVIDFNNSMYFKYIKSRINGSAILDHNQNFTLDEFKILLNENGYDIFQVKGLTTNISGEDIKFTEMLAHLSSHKTSEIFRYNRFLVNVTPNRRDDITLILSEIQQGINIDSNLKKLELFGVEKVISTAVGFNNAIQILNYIAVLNQERGNYESILPFLLKAFELDSQKVDTLYNLGVLFNSIGETQSALDYLELIQEKDEEILSFINKLKTEIEVQNSLLTRVKYIIRRIENDIEPEESLNALIEMKRHQEIEIETILNCIRLEIINKETVLNQIALSFYTVGIIDEVIPLYQLSLEINPLNEDALFNLGYLLKVMGENDLAIKYLEAIQSKDTAIVQMISEIRGERMYG